jgi:hypothetical protein
MGGRRHLLRDGKVARMSRWEAVAVGSHIPVAVAAAHLTEGSSAGWQEVAVAPTEGMGRPVRRRPHRVASTAEVSRGKRSQRCPASMEAAAELLVCPAK